MMQPGRNYHKGFDCWRWIRGQESDRYRTAPNPNPPVSEEYCEKHDDRLHQFCLNVADFRTEEDYFTAQVYSTAMRWLEKNYATGKFFLWIDSFDPHEPWFPPYNYADMYDPDYKGIEPIGVAYGDWREHLNERQLKRMRALYAGEVTFLDRNVGKLITLLKDLRIYEETLIVLISDHGHLLGEHNMIGKGWETLSYKEVLDIVLFMRFPGSEFAGSRVRSLCYNIDVIPTIFSHLGLEIPGQFEGIDLHPMIEGKVEHLRDCVTCSFYARNATVKTLDWTLLYDIDHEPLLLFDRKHDPKEENNLIAEYADVIEHLQKLEKPDWERRPRATNKDL